MEFLYDYIIIVVFGHDIISSVFQWLTGSINNWMNDKLDQPGLYLLLLVSLLKISIHMEILILILSIPLNKWGMHSR